MIWAVQVYEDAPPAEVEPIEWLLLTTVAVETIPDAIERVAWYVCRWGIEVWHRILKSGCRIEERQLETAARLQRCLALYSVIAWRIFYATMLARAVPDVPCSVLLALEEWQAPYWAIHHCTTPPPEPPSLGQAVQWIARWAVLWADVAATNRARRCCGGVFNISLTSQRCTALCAQSPQVEKCG